MVVLAVEELLVNKVVMVVLMVVVMEVLNLVLREEVLVKVLLGLSGVWVDHSQIMHPKLRGN